MINRRQIELILELVNAELHALETPFPDERTKERLTELWDIRLDLIEVLEKTP